MATVNNLANTRFVDSQVIADAADVTPQFSTYQNLYNYNDGGSVNMNFTSDTVPATNDVIILEKGGTGYNYLMTAANYAANYTAN